MQWFIHAGLFLFAAGTLYLALAIDHEALNRLSEFPAVRVIADSTLEIYEFQLLFCRVISDSCPFPINVFLFFALGLGGGCLTHLIFRKIRWRREARG